MKKIAMVTGATSGIGRATATMLSKLGFNLIITGRRQERLDVLQAELNNNGSEVMSLCFDIRKNKETENAIQQLSNEWAQIDILINNAGLAAGADPIYNGLWSDWEQMIDTNIKGLLYLSKLIIPGMMERKQGHIVNVSSIAGKETYANGNVYCATKHAVEAITKGMRIDLLPYNIKVSSVSPGMVETEFSIVRFHGDKGKADNVYKGLTPLFENDIAETIEFIVTRPPHVNINDILVMPTAQATAVYNHREE
ncbi:SDR family NAD(P)-dependent oxidoreductase [Carboxylicivirga sp. M1479]|uniref:SDR family NAD(P)-dependent oxidoreductase n=1 Tax=Carboxylicivirga sp. M1479 TaxID=2594476 RepID=UPI001177F065|nr:SDR family NAD(P)-dependent oxidoreductase [Carboxylicivirga sp. M1479]TRX66213.1 SDR family NAD(P)-dependent oxidoreductase [Carboxylicivirga sp. M1479]